MSGAKYLCLFDNSKECPVRTANEWLSLRGSYAPLLEACVICPIHEQMMRVKHTLK